MDGWTEGSQALGAEHADQLVLLQFFSAHLASKSVRMGGMNEVSQILLAMDQGDAASAAKLLPLVYDELRKLAGAHLANEAPGQTLQPTALVHEAYVRLVGHDREQLWDSRGHFFAAAAESMRRILVDRARRKLRPKHAGDRKRVDLEHVCLTDDASSRQLIALSEALDQLEQQDRRKAELVKLRYFVGMSEEEAAKALGISRATASRYWTYAKSWLHCALVDAVNSKFEQK